jgi:hypothetical protein
MSGLLVLFACLAVAVAIAIPTVARAASPTNNPANTMMRKAGGEQEEFLTLNGGIFIKGEYSKWKFSSTECKDLIVVARKSGKAIGDVSGPILGKTNATLNGDGTCVYSLKVPADQNVTVGVQPFSWGGSKLSSSEYAKLSQQDKTSWKVQKISDGWQKVGLNGDGFPAKLTAKLTPEKVESHGESKEYRQGKFKGEVSMPLFIKLMPGQ